MNEAIEHVSENYRFLKTEDETSFIVVRSIFEVN
jgi:hypothetical protein